MNKLHTYTIMRLDTEHIDEICDDIKYQYENGIVSCALFKMTLVPEGNPPIDKAEIMCAQYDKFREKLTADGIPNGILVQASIGHGYKLSSPSAFQKVITTSDGEQKEVVCPYDKDFQNYIYKTLRTIALHSPDAIMIDDDLRLIARGSHDFGCCCPLHLKRFNELAKTDFTREDIIKILLSDGNDEYKKIYIETQRESLVETAKMIRKGIDSVDENIPASYCCVGRNAEFAYEISSVLAGKNNPVTVRINNGNYTAAGARNLSSCFQRAAAQIAKLKGKADIILAETDTCPQNRYSTGAMQLHAHYTGTILEGACGAKQWITRLASHEPQSGKAYRNILKKYSKFYETLADIVPHLKWQGFKIPVCGEAIYDFRQNSADAAADGHNAWCNCVLERLGLPVYFSAGNGGILCLEDEVFLSDEALIKAASKTIITASDSAEQLEKRGLSNITGIRVEPWSGKPASTERSGTNAMPMQFNLKKLIPIYPNTEDLSSIYYTVDQENFEKLAPAVTAYKNEFGGTCYTFAGTPNAAYNYMVGFSFLNYTRKQQMINILKQSDELSIYYPNDEEVYFRAAYTDSGEIFTAVFNIGLDPIEKLDIFCEKNISEISKLMPDGTFMKLTFTSESGLYTIDTPCNTLEPVILVMK